MIRKIKALGLAVFAVMAFGALSATAASAAEFHAETSHTILAGAQHAGEDTFIVNAGTVRCKSATYTGTQSTATTSTVTVTPTYKECSAFGFLGATIHTNGCGYLFHTEAGTVNPVTGSGPGKVTIECPEAEKTDENGEVTKPYIAVTSPGICEVRVPAQGPLPGITYTNAGAHSGTGRDVTVDVNIIDPEGAEPGISYTQINKGFCLAGSFTNGKYTGAATVQGKNTEGGAVGIWVH